MAKGNKTYNQLIIDTLLTGESLQLRHITEIISTNLGKKVKTQDVSSVLSRLADSNRCELGYLINKRKADKNGFVYKLVSLARKLEPEQLYDLSRNTGKDRFSLKDAIKKHPGLKNYTKPSESNRAASKTTEQLSKKESAPRSIAEISSDEALRHAMADLIQKIKGQGGLKVNVNLNIQFKTA